MPNQTRQVAENALMLGIAAVLLFLSVYTVLGIVLFMVLPIPFILLALRRTGKDMLFISLAYTFLGFILGSYTGAYTALMAAVTGAVMGLLYHRSKSAYPAVLGGAAMSFLSTVGSIAILTFVMGVDLIEEVQQAASVMKSGQWDFLKPASLSDTEWKKMVDQRIQLLTIAMPFFFISSSLLASGVNHWLARTIGKRLGKQLPALKPFREWSFPRSTVWYYFVVLVAMLLTDESVLYNAFWGKALFNVSVALQAIFLIQGVSFCVYFLYLKNKSKFTPLFIVSLFIFPLLTTILSLLGIFDVATGLRKKLETRR